jgi:hypothetical protein
MSVGMKNLSLKRAVVAGVAVALGAVATQPSATAFPGTFKDPVYARYADVDASPLFGE